MYAVYEKMYQCAEKKDFNDYYIIFNRHCYFYLCIMFNYYSFAKVLIYFGLLIFWFVDSFVFVFVKVVQRLIRCTH
jgi:hypothetical protein